MRAELLRHSEGHCQDKQSLYAEQRRGRAAFRCAELLHHSKAVAKSSRVLPEVFDSLCPIVARKSRSSTRRTSSLLLKAAAKTSGVLLEVFDSLYR